MKSNRTLAVLLLTAMLLPACGAANSSEATATSSANVENVTEATTTALSIASVVPENVDLGGREIKFFAEQGNTGTVTMREDSIYQEEDTGDIVYSAIYNRNMKVEDYLNNKIVVSMTCKPQDGIKTLSNSVAAGSDDFDVFAGYQCYSISASALGYMMPMDKVANLDLTAPYWAADYISDISYKGTYWAVGDIDLCFIGGFYSTMVNTRLWNSIRKDTNIYDVVRDGKWTFDYLRAACEDIWQDVNGDGTTSFGDILGAQYTLADMFAAGMNARFSERDKDGTPYLTVNSEHILDVWSKMYQFLFETKGVTGTGAQAENAADVLFCEGTMLTYTHMLSSTMTYLREMEDDYYMLPVPMMDEKQGEYTSRVHDSATLYGLPVTAKKTDEIGVTLEAMEIESHLTVMPAYYDEALKYKYTRDADSAEMIDLIRDNAKTDFAYIYSESIGGGLGTTGKGIHRIFRTGYTGKLESLSSHIASNIDAYNKNFADLLACYDKLAKEQK